ncbi:hypothetical protein EI94DRAFT_1317397 [Lactarius quietus]|nr:hypothetical protein EI94DRAFT_1317397 [Lactarius quietus]
MTVRRARWLLLLLLPLSFPREPVLLLPLPLPFPSRRGTTVSCAGSTRRTVTPISSSSHALAPHELSIGSDNVGSAASKSSILGSSESSTSLLGVGIWRRGRSGGSWAGARV